VPSDPIPDWVIQYRRHTGTRVYGLRMARGWTQEQLAERTGLARETISSVETGAHAPLLDHLVLICDALGAPMRRLFE
jgi:transcriptional regulator with XRE-family HTH domain